ncbi:MAG: NAD(P)H-dependent oxidoreductase subunit E [Chloroflexi bacterium]|nr:NAD(P)H-dependent oxidoreductase subunit E [Chloroflexota bacterium]MCL5110823.1 NAD(P)H-dependent oxidoreductase subunit E [Chloroflexota bacterium]
MEDLLSTYRQDGDLLALLKRVRRRHGGLGRPVLAQLASELDLTVGELYGIVSFYSFLSPAPVGRNLIRVCRCLPCTMQESGTVLEAIRQELAIGPGETTADGRFTLQLVNCIGACELAPAMMVNESRHGPLTTRGVVEILRSYS